MAAPESDDDHTTDAEAAEQDEVEESVSDSGGDSDPGASSADG